MRHLFVCLLSLLLIALLPACIHHKTLVNFNEGPAFSASPETITLKNSLVLQSDDLLSITIQTLDPIASAPFNGGIPAAGSGNTTGSANGQASTASANSAVSPTYLIDQQGLINIPLLGKVQAAGLSTTQLRDTLSKKLAAQYLNDPIVNVRLLNFKFTVLGEVGHAGSFSITGERINILEALGMAGDVTIYGTREDVLVIREQGGMRSYGHVNLHQRDLFLSPYFYLQQNDLIYIAPTKSKIGASADQSTKVLQFVFPIITTISILINLFR
jgi:polysaccharide export outer membrane protein